MDSSCCSCTKSSLIDILEIYRRYCDIRSGESQNSRETLAQLLKLVELRGQASSPSSDLSKLMSYLDLTVDSCRFSCFYDFVFFMCREKGQKNITIAKAIEAWKLVLRGRFRLLSEWCTFVQKHQRHNISEDTWQQVLAFSRCVHEDLEGYDPKGAWPVLIDDFVAHMHRITIPNSRYSRIRSFNYGDSKAQACRSDDILPGLKLFSGSKRKPEVELFHSLSSPELLMNFKRNRSIEMKDKSADWAAKLPGNTSDDQVEIVKPGGGLLGSSKSLACTVERSLSEGFAELLPTGSHLQFDQKARIINNCFQPY